MVINAPQPRDDSSERIERYEGSDEHVYVIEYFADRFVARRFDGGAYTAGPLPVGAIADMSRDQAARAFAICKIEEKIRACASRR